MLIYRGIMVIVVVVGVVLVRSFNWDIVIIFLVFVLKELFKIFFYVIYEFKKFFIREFIYKDICFVVYYIIFVLIINVRKNIYFY